MITQIDKTDYTDLIEKLVVNRCNRFFRICAINFTGGGFMKKIFLVIAAIVLMPAIASALDFEMSLKDKINSFNVEASASGGQTALLFFTT